MTSDETECSDNDLHFAVRYSDLNGVKEALQCRLSPNRIGMYKWSALHEAASNGYNEVLKLLLKHGGNPNKPDKLGSNTAVHYAALEGHPACLAMLLDYGGDYEIHNSDGESALDVATSACRRVIERKRVDRLMKASLDIAKKDATDDLKRLHAIGKIPGPVCRTTTNSDSPEKSDKIDIRVDESVRVNAWAPQIKDSSLGALGSLHISFEYHSKKNSLKIRLWKLTGLMFSATQSASISTIYIKSSFVPDVTKESKRKSDEIKLSSLLNTEQQTASNSTAGRKPSVVQTQVFTNDAGEEVVFQPVTLKFSKPLVYENINKETVENKVILLQVCARQKYSYRSYKISDITLPLKVAVTKIVKESFPLRVCFQTVMPDTMMVLPEIKNPRVTASDPNLRLPKSPLHTRHMRPASDINLREILSISSRSETVSIDIPHEEDAEAKPDELQNVQIHTDHAQEEISIAMPGAFEEEVDKPDDAPEIRVLKPPTSPDIHITINNQESDSENEIADRQKHKIRTKFSKFIHGLKHDSDDNVRQIESGTRAAGLDNQGYISSLTDVNENPIQSQTKLKLKPKTSQQMPSKSPIRKSFEREERSLRGSDVVVSVDLELEDFDVQPAGVHMTPRRNRVDENMV